MTFKDYITSRPARADLRGDFLRLARANRALSEVTSWHELRAHMQQSGTPFHVLAAGEQVWSNYLIKVRDAQRSAQPASNGDTAV